MLSPTYAVFLPSGGLVVSDSRNGRLQLLSDRGEPTAMLGTGLDELCFPTGLASSSDGDVLYVADPSNSFYLQDPSGEVELRPVRAGARRWTRSSGLERFQSTQHGGDLLLALHLDARKVREPRDKGDWRCGHGGLRAGSAIRAVLLRLLMEQRLHV